jgi:hypothetical protein
MLSLVFDGLIGSRFCKCFLRKQPTPPAQSQVEEDHLQVIVDERCWNTRFASHNAMPDKSSVNNPPCLPLQMLTFQHLPHHHDLDVV